MTERKPMAFMSYIHAADDADNGRLTKFCERLSQEMFLHIGEEFPIFQDHTDIGWGQSWKKYINDSLNHTTFLLPIITPGFFKSKECRDELNKFLEREKGLNRDDLILPILYIDAPAKIKENLRAKDKLAEIIFSRHYIDWQELRFKDLNSDDSRKAISDLAVQICNALKRLDDSELMTESRKIDRLHEAEASETNPSKFTDGRGSDVNSQIGLNLEKEIVEFLRRLGCSNNLADRQNLLESISRIQPQLQELQSKLVDWGEKSDEWIKKFNYQLYKYSDIYATDYYPRSSLGSPRFNKYLRKQYVARLERIKLKPDHCFRFSQPVFDAIKRTNWHPDHVMWEDYEMKRITHSSQEHLEIVRILIRPKDTVQARRELENLDFDHRIFAIPLFVLDCQQLEPEKRVDFAIGFDEYGEIIKSCEFMGIGRGVEEVDPRGRGLELKVIFDKMLSDGTLKTVNDFIETN